MNFFEYRDGEMHAENIKVSEIAEHVGTPFYLYSSASLAYQFNQFKEAFGDIDLLICYAVKANTNQAVIKTLGDLPAFKARGHRARPSDACGGERSQTNRRGDI